jgi:SAM-dependent methyltransferase
MRYFFYKHDIPPGFNSTIRYPHPLFVFKIIKPPLQFESNKFDIVYGISIFTHLSKEMHFAWFTELIRILKPGGLLFLTFHGEVHTFKLSDSEKDLFKKGELVIKANTKEGHRTFGAFHPESFVIKLIGENEILEHKPGENKDGKAGQDVWIVRKK